MKAIGGCIMNTKTMEGLVGARTNMDLLNTPFRVYKEAERRGDTATMERAMGYATEFSDRANEYKEVADRGMKEDAEEAREKAKIEREEAIQKRKEERKKLEERIEERRNENKETDTVEVSEEGKVLLKENDVIDNNGSENMNLDNTVSTKTKTGKEPMIYTKAGEVSQPEQTTSILISV